MKKVFTQNREISLLLITKRPKYSKTYIKPFINFIFFRPLKNRKDWEKSEKTRRKTRRNYWRSLHKPSSKTEETGGSSNRTWNKYGAEFFLDESELQRSCETSKDSWFETSYTWQGKLSNNWSGTTYANTGILFVLTRLVILQGSLGVILKANVGICMVLAVKSRFWLKQNVCSKSVFHGSNPKHISTDLYYK